MPNPITLFVNANDLSGGAARAAYRLHNGLRQLNTVSQMLVLRKKSNDPSVRELQGSPAALMRRRGWGIDRLPTRLYKRRDPFSVWSVNWFPYLRTADFGTADILHFHWIGAGMIPIGLVSRIKTPVVWTLHDEWAFTGGCHYAGDCNRFEMICGKCPQLGSSREFDLSRMTHMAKTRSWQNTNMFVVSPSRWLLERARRSSLFRERPCTVIPNGIDTDLYQPYDKAISRSENGLPNENSLILFGAVQGTANPRKGYRFLNQALDYLAKSSLGSPFHTVTFGAEELRQSAHSTSLGVISDDRTLASIYSAVDVFVAPSTQENLSNTIMESLACGTPVVAFDIGGNPDMIDHMQNGYLAKPYDVEDLANGIKWVIEDPERHRTLCQNAREKVLKNFRIEDVARRYIALYEEVLEAPSVPQ